MSIQLITEHPVPMLQPNQPITWRLKVSGGAHPKIVEISAVVVRSGRKRVLIEGVESKRQAWVDPENLTTRSE